MRTRTGEYKEGLEADRARRLGLPPKDAGVKKEKDKKEERRKWVGRSAAHTLPACRRGVAQAGGTAGRAHAAPAPAPFAPARRKDKKEKKDKKKKRRREEKRSSKDKKKRSSKDKDKKKEKKKSRHGSGSSSSSSDSGGSDSSDSYGARNEPVRLSEFFSHDTK
jgi:hypothetical protein